MKHFAFPNIKEQKRKKKKKPEKKYKVTKKVEFIYITSCTAENVKEICPFRVHS